MTDELRFDAAGPVLLVGGYGTVGSELARLAAPSWPLLLTGRRPEGGSSRGEALGAELGAEVRRWDLTDPAPFAAAVRAVVGVVNDPGDRVLRAAVDGGVPYVDITRWTARLQRAVAVVSVLKPVAPVLFSSGWMGGTTNLMAAALAAELGGAERVEVAIRWDLKDRAGADSVEFMDRLGLDYEVLENGQSRRIMPLSGAGRVMIGDLRTKVARIDTPEQFTLPISLGVRSAITRIGFGSALSTSALLAVKRTGFFRWGRGDCWAPVRRSLLYSPGEGGVARVRMDVEGPAGRRAAILTDPLGQAHLTAVGALMGLRRVLGADGAPPAPGVAFPEMTPRPRDVPGFLLSMGVSISEQRPGAVAVAAADNGTEAKEAAA
ncbi:saccharopine dehydrogenase [Streptomyces piniterrae]|uniref:Saccharopine dehydrogenase n=1 Tax=Streptomyces piniterrae TaxID=2571125 RepID=A0A4U0NQN7_9ACTN|nr:saccharopine dehydrogenase [Streptomyces piniterrae]TJZ56879.1 saccharopine dehydrogenase [Streptomyces piniterrae]